MSEHTAALSWKREEKDFAYASYSRDHTWTFDGGVVVKASAAPAYVGNKDLIDPEEAFVASLAACHMLTFLALAARQRYVVDDYQDSAIGHMKKNAEGKLAMTRIVLQPKVSFSEVAKPSDEELRKLHHLAHENCFLANSVHASIEVVPA